MLTTRDRYALGLGSSPMRKANSARILAVAAVLFVLALGCSPKASPEVLAPPCAGISDRAASLGAAVLELRLAQVNSGRAASSDGPVAWAAYELHATKGSSSDEALAALLAYYLGEATDEDTLDEITKRGPRMVSWLEHFRRLPACGWQAFESLLSQGNVRERIYASALDMISRGETLGLD